MNVPKGKKETKDFNDNNTDIEEAHKEEKRGLQGAKATNSDRSDLYITTGALNIALLFGVKSV